MYSVILEHISKSYLNGDSELNILDDASYCFEKGKFYCIVGRSGLGKTTLLNIIGGFEKNNEGSIVLCNHNLSDVNSKKLDIIRRHDLGFVFQNFSLIERYSVYDNLDIPLYFSGVKSRKKRNEIIKQSLSMVGLSEKCLYQQSKLLSGGEQQRVAICRALINNPTVILADEPTGNLDEENENNIINIFLDTIKDRNRSIIMVTHNNNIAKKADVLLTLHHGKIVEIGE